MRVALVGAGPRADTHLAALRASGAGTPVAIWDRNPDRARALADRWGIPSSFTDITAMVAATSPDLVDIVTHPAFRLEPMTAAIDGGARAILVEKPLALTVAELDAMDALGAFIAVNTQYPWMSHWVRFRDRIADLGTITAITASTGEGILDQGAHQLSLALSVAAAAGLPPATFVSSRTSGEAEYAGMTVPADVHAEFALGSVPLTLTCGSSAPRVPGETVRWYQQQIEIAGTAGTLWVSLNQGWRWGDEEGTTDWPRDDEQSQSDLFVALADAVGDHALQESFGSRLAVASAQARLVLAALA